MLAILGRREQNISGAIFAAGGYRVLYKGGRRSARVFGLGDAAFWNRFVLLDIDSFLIVIVLIWAVYEDVGSKIIWKCIRRIQ